METQDQDQDQALTPIEKRMDPEGFEFTPAAAVDKFNYIEYLRQKGLEEVENE